MMTRPFRIAAMLAVAATGAVLGAAPQTGVLISGELRQWHKVTLTLDGPVADEAAPSPNNPFTDYRMTVTFTHESGSPRYVVPGYFAADGNAAETSATTGNKWRAHFSPDKTGRWEWRIAFLSGAGVATAALPRGQALGSFDGRSGSIQVLPTNKTGLDFRAKGRLQYVGERYLRFAGTGEYFLKAGSDSPETLLAFADFDGTSTGKTALHTYAPHSGNWRTGDPTWKGGKGKGLIGALNYLSSKGANSFSFLTYNAGGDGDNVWPFASRNDKFHYDVSKLDQWQIVFDHAQAKGVYLHFKLQETEIDDDIRGNPYTAPRGGGAGPGGGPQGGRGAQAAPTAGAPAGPAGAPAQAPPAAGRGGAGGNQGPVVESLDSGNLGPERRLYMRELIARFGYELALNWNLGEENTQTTAQQRAMAQYIHDLDPYDHIVVIHTFPDAQDVVYQPLLGQPNFITGVSLQNAFDATHERTVRWVQASEASGVPWVTANDEQGSANLGTPPDPGFPGFTGKDAQGNDIQSIHDIRKYTLWGNLMAGGAGVEYYAGYTLPENDLTMENFKSRDKSWEQSARALKFFRTARIPFWQMRNEDRLVGNHVHDNRAYCFAKAGELYLVYLPNGGSADLDLRNATGVFGVTWFNPRVDAPIARGTVATVTGGRVVSLGKPPADPNEDWLAIVRKPGGGQQVQ